MPFPSPLPMGAFLGTEAHPQQYLSRPMEMLLLQASTASPVLLKYSSTKTRMGNKLWNSFSPTASLLEMAEPTRLKFN